MKTLPPKSQLAKSPAFVSLMSKYSKSPTKRRLLLKLGDSTDVKACCEVYLNVLKGNIKLHPKDVKRIKKKIKVLKHLVDKKTSLTAKKNILGGQVGGFLPLLLAPLLGGILGKLFK